MDPASERLAGIAFGRFQVSPDRREVLADGRPVKLGGRAFDVLMALIEAHGAVVSKDALMTRVWSGRIIEENSLAAQIAALRAAFGAERALIRTVSGRGYQFTGEIRILSASPDKARAGRASAEHALVLPPTNLPEPVSELIGREEELDEVLRVARAHRLVTLTGAGGIGKTTLALALARELRPHFADGVWLAEFSALADPGLVPAAVAAAVGLEPGGGEVSAQRVAQALADRRLLLILDTCEHVIAAAATMAEAMLGASSVPHIIATSREPLRAGGEWVYPVQPLAVPAVDVAADDDPLRYGAVRLFIERARAAEPHFAPDRRLMAMIAAICRRLDGIPLAIELAAARAAALGIEALAARLDDRFHLLTGGRRTALPRHQALRATLDWGYELLAEPERVLLRRLAIFAGPFSLEAAAAVAASPELPAPNVIEGLLGLVAKSLVVAGGEGAVRYRLLDTTRAYALEKLEKSGERDEQARRHAEYFRNFFEQAEAEWERRPIAEWLADYGWQIDNLRAALDWSVSPNGDASIGLALTAAAVPLWTHLSLLDECRGRVERAIAALAAGADRDARREMKLQAALGASLIYTKGTVPKVEAAYRRALALAEKLDDTEHQLRSLWGLWTFYNGSGQLRDALALAERFHAVATNGPDPNDPLIGERMISVSQHFLGDLLRARHHIEHMLMHYVPSAQKSHIIRFQTDQRAMARAHLAQILWLQGLPDQAVRAAKSSIEDARAANHANSLCYTLAVAACAIALLVGDLAAAEHYAEVLLDHATRHSLAHWRAFGRSYQGALTIARGDVIKGLPLLHAGVDDRGKAGLVSTPRLIGFLMAEALGRAGQMADGLAAVEGALAWAEGTGERWAISEVLRLKGELLLLQGAKGAAAAEDHFRQALDWARRQGALSWELRAATSLARLLRDQGCSAEARALLQPVYDRFTEGFDTTDLKAAKALLDALAEPKALRTRIS